MKYIFVTGAPGSKWSSVVKNIYYSKSIDNSDYSEERTYHHDASGNMQLMHLGAYYDPGMEFGDFFDKIDCHDKVTCEKEFDRPFNGQGTRIIKSHVFSYNIDYLLQTWRDVPIVLVHRDNDSCLGWWVRCGHFNITYPSYDSYYVDLTKMGKLINDQNRYMKEAWNKYEGKEVSDNIELCDTLGLQHPSASEIYRQNYEKNNIKVKVINYAK